MNKFVNLILGEGNFEEGFPAILQIWEEGKPISSQYTGYLPPEPNLPKLYKDWQSMYRCFVEPIVRLEKKTAQITNVSIVGIKEIADDLSNSLNQWLKSQPFISIREALLKNLRFDERVRFIIQTSNIELWKLPWQMWDFLALYSNVEVAFSALNYKQVTSYKTSQNPVSILGIMGDNTGLNLEQDYEILASIPNAKTCFLSKPERKQLNEQLWKQPYDILFFAGHSRTEGEIGRIDINESESLTIAELRDALENATSQGLQLAIFNSCDGLGLARELAALNIPQIIVMREPVPDKVAQEFLKYFFVAFSSGLSLALAVREARERLQGLEDMFPCASWLPVIFQNPAVIPPTWEDLVGISILENKLAPSKFSGGLLGALIIAVLAVITAGLTGYKWLQGAPTSKTDEVGLEEIKYIQEIQERGSIEESQKEATRKALLNLVNKWLQAKQEIFAPPYNRQLAAELTTGNLYIKLTKPDGAIAWLKRNNGYYRYGVPKVVDIQNFNQDGDSAYIDVEIHEKLTFHLKGITINSKTESYSTSNIGTYRYSFKMINDQWKIVNVQTIR